MILTFKFNLDIVKKNRRAKYLGHTSVRAKGIVET